MFYAIIVFPVSFFKTVYFKMALIVVVDHCLCVKHETLDMEKRNAKMIITYVYN